MDILANTHLHITTWVVALILFFVALAIKNPKVVHMILRIDYLLIVATGVALFIRGMDYGEGMLYGFKFLAGLAVIAMMEMALVKKGKGKPYTTFLVLVFVFLLITLFLGFKLPMGFNFLA